LSYVGQTVGHLKRRYKEHIRYIKQIDSQSAYALHNFNNHHHKYGPIITTMTLLKHITKTSLLIRYEQFYIETHYYHKEQILQHNTGDNNPMYHLSSNPALRYHTQHTHFSTAALYQIPRTQYRKHCSTYNTAYTDRTYSNFISLYITFRYTVLHFLKTFQAQFYGFIRLYVYHKL
jgi:hypothetical protein